MEQERPKQTLWRKPIPENALAPITVCNHNNWARETTESCFSNCARIIQQTVHLKWMWEPSLPNGCKCNSFSTKLHFKIKWNTIRCHLDLCSHLLLSDLMVSLYTSKNIIRTWVASVFNHLSVLWFWAVRCSYLGKSSGPVLCGCILYRQAWKMNRRLVRANYKHRI